MKRLQPFALLFFALRALILAGCPSLSPKPPVQEEDHRRMLFYGQYSFVGKIGLDIDAFAENLGKSRYNGVRFHILSPWDNDRAVFKK